MDEFEKKEIEKKIKALEDWSCEDKNFDIYPKVIVELDKIIKNYPDYIDALNFKADLLLQMNRKEECYAICQRVLMLEPNNAEANSMLSSINFNLVKWIKGFINDPTQVIIIIANVIFALVIIYFMYFRT